MLKCAATLNAAKGRLRRFYAQSKLRLRHVEFRAFTPAAKRKQQD